MRSAECRLFILPGLPLACHAKGDKMRRCYFLYFNGLLGGQSPDVLDQSSPNFQNRYAYGWP